MNRMLELVRGGLAGLLFCVWLGGCAISPRPAPIPDLATLPARAPQAQRLVFEHNGEWRELLALIRHNQTSLRLALLSPQGQRLLTLEQDSAGARFLPGAAFEPPFSAQWLAERIAWSLWPADELEQAFAGSHWAVQQHEGGHRIYYRKQLMATVSDGDNCHIVDDVQAGYRLYRAPLEPDATQEKSLCPIP